MQKWFNYLARSNWVLSCRYPYVTGTSVIGIKYKDGILMAADTGGHISFKSFFVHLKFLILFLL